MDDIISTCTEHNEHRKWIYMVQEPIKDQTFIESKFECWSCHRILMKALGWEKEKKKHGRRRKNKA